MRLEVQLTALLLGIILTTHIAAKSTILDTALDTTALAVLIAVHYRKAKKQQIGLAQEALKNIIYSIELKVRGSHASAIYETYKKLDNMAYGEAKSSVKPLVADLFKDSQSRTSIYDAPMKTIVAEAFGSLYTKIVTELSRAEDKSSVALAVVMLSSTMLGLLYGFSIVANSMHVLVAFVLLTELLSRRVGGSESLDRL